MSNREAGSQEPQFDAAQIATLRDLRGGTLLPRLLVLYRDNTGQQLQLLLAAAGEGDTAKVTGIAHAMKSASLSVGAVQVGALCASLELAGRTGALDDGGLELARRIDEAFTALLPELEGMLAC